MGDDQVTLREAAALAQRSTRAILYHYHSGLVSATLVKDRLWFSVSELAAKLPGGLPGLSAMQPEVPNAGPRLLPPPATRRPLVKTALLATCRTVVFLWGPLPRSMRLLEIVLLAVYWTVALPLVPLARTWPSLLISTERDAYWRSIFWRLPESPCVQSYRSSQLRRGRGDRQQNRPPQVR